MATNRTVLFAHLPGTKRTAERRHYIYFMTVHMHTELIFENFFRTFLGNEYATFTRRRYFGGDSTGNLYKDNMINFLSLIFKFYIWKCKLCFKVPDAESAESFSRRLIQDTYNNNNLFRKNWNESGLQYRFLKVNQFTCNMH